ncbi:MAG TPA: adenylate/guanylate cyclase domain-containing protein [Beijerinckiaceae bacterium]|nr:adenylate/guanylate cyclase domain-containing protein [Beijerinckiaceae bacterium]
MSRWRRLLKRFGLGRAICVVLLVDLVILRVWDPLPLEMLRLRTFDLYQTLRPRESPLRPVTIVDIDEESLKSIGQWPWPRTIVADIVTRLTQLGAVAIGFDVVFAEPDRASPGVAAEALRGLDEQTREKLRALPSNDQVLAEAIKRSRVVVGQSGYRLASQDTSKATRIQSGFAMLGGDPKPFLVPFPDLLRNVAPIEEAAAGGGLFSLRQERDGTIRRIPLVMTAEGVMVPSLTLDLLRVVTGAGAILVRTDAAGIRSVAIPGLELPTDGNGRLWIYFGERDPARYVSAKDVLQGRVAPDKVAGKLVLIGTSATGLQDIRTTPIDPVMPGVEIHAQLLENILTNSMLRAPSHMTAAELTVAVLVSLAIIALAPIIGAGMLLVLGGGVAALIAGISWYYFYHEHILFDVTFPFLASFSIYGMLVFTNYLRAHTERRQIRSAFSQYLSPALVEQLAQSPEKLVLGGEERVMTVLFSDVRGFTAISEMYKHDPQGLTALMNRLLTPMTNVIIERKGTIDKYIGDAIMAFWNAPLDDPAQEANACNAALQMLRCVAEINRVREKEAEEAGQPFVPVRIGVGLNTGPCVVGNMGSDLHFNYSVLGDMVNLASRLEGQTKTYGVPIVIGATTAQAVQGALAVLEIDFVQVKGKTEPELVYTLLGGPDVAETPRFQKLRDLNGLMLTAYRNQNWAGALEAILQCREAGREFGLDEFYDRYVARIRTLLDQPPEADWNGVFVAETK